MDEAVQRVSVDLTGAAEDVPELTDGEGTPLALPQGATSNPDGSVTLELAYPVRISYRAAGGQEVKSDEYSSLTLRRLRGADMRQVIDAKGGRGAQIALAKSTKMTAAKISLLYGKMDAVDVNAANAVVAALCGFDGDEGLPSAAEVGDDGRITLPLAYPVEPTDFEPRQALIFRRLTGDDLIAIAQSKSVLVTAMARGAGMTPREADVVFDLMDAADVMAVQRVVGFLSGSGRQTGR